MKNICLVAAVLSIFAGGAFADTTMTLTGFGDGYVFGGIFIDPYTATVGSQTNVSVLCDDWSNNTYQNETWKVNVINLSTAGTTGSPLFGNNQALYNELAWLGSQMLLNPTDHTTQLEASFAIWDLSYPYNSPQDSTAPLAFLASQFSDGTNDVVYKAAVSLENKAKTTESTFNAQGWSILTPIAGTQSAPGVSNPGLPQEFLTYQSIPEPSSLGFLLAAGLVAVLCVKRRRVIPGAAR